MDLSSADELVDAGVEERSLSNDDDEDVFAADILADAPLAEGQCWVLLFGNASLCPDEVFVGPELLSEFSEPKEAVVDSRFFRLVSSCGTRNKKN